MIDSVPTHLNLAACILQENVHQHPDKNALIFQDSVHKEQWSFRQIYRAVLHTAGQLRTFNLDKSSRVLVRLENTPEFASLFFTAIAAGLVPIPCSPQLSSHEVEYFLKDAKAALIVTSEKLPVPSEVPEFCQLITLKELKMIQPQPGDCIFENTLANDPAFLIYTSGTTSYPKGVLHAQRNILGRTPMIKGWTGLRENDIFLHAG